MALSEAFMGSLGRNLSTEEVQLLQILSPQGVAKVNADLAQGINLEMTLAQLKLVHQAADKRKALAEGLLPQTMLSVVGQMTRSLTADEMILFAGVPSATLQHRIVCRTKGGEALDDVVQELAEEHGQAVLRGEAQRLASE
eukprot:RCo018254